ncbi:hypothetical protein OEA41_010259 [Lepraria neglecta]|uniref:Uncharacterized protein n=1 Tax=Lepraria neglecta TaxID=209136 RepID=A0AAD9YYQ3_9LECA|nr:hypothetical protein OEA41_010259 [Lepraria neglecta]
MSGLYAAQPAPGWALASARKTQIDLHIEYLEEDFLIRSAACPPTALSDLVFVSDVPKSWTAQSADTELISTNGIIQQPMRLSYLEKATIQTSQWLSIDSIKTILCNCPRLKHLTLSDADAKRTNSQVFVNKEIFSRDGNYWAFCGDGKGLWEWFNSRKELDWEH